MLMITCPWCGPRDEIEFRYGGQAGITYDPDDLAGYLFLRDNPKGWFHERWMHSHGCRRWFGIRRHTVTMEVE